VLSSSEQISADWGVPLELVGDPFSVPPEGPPRNLSPLTLFSSQGAGLKLGWSDDAWGLLTVNGLLRLQVGELGAEAANEPGLGARKEVGEIAGCVRSRLRMSLQEANSDKRRELCISYMYDHNVSLGSCQRYSESTCQSTVEL
jgi:hypothetical protein